jgi:hypothetical protein
LTKNNVLGPNYYCVTHTQREKEYTRDTRQSSEEVAVLTKLLTSIDKYNFATAIILWGRLTVLLAKLSYPAVAHLAATTWEQKLIVERDDISNAGTQYRLACDFFKTMEDLVSKKNSASQSHYNSTNWQADSAGSFRSKQKATAKPGGAESAMV